MLFSSHSNTGKNNSEDELVKLIAQVVQPHSARIILGIGDDCAVIRNDRKMSVVTCDALVEHIHFELSWYSWWELGWKAAAVTLSDVASMGMQPVCIVSSMALPSYVSSCNIEDFYRGAKQICSRCNCDIVGGDLVASPGPLFINVTGIGQGTCFLSRSRAKPGDLVAMTGTCGDSAAGLEILRGFLRDLPNSVEKALVRAHKTPQPRVAEGKLLASLRNVHSCIDISDGLGKDLARIAAASQVRIIIFKDSLPISEEMQNVRQQHKKLADRLIIAGGEQYELVFTCRPDIWSKIQEEFSRNNLTNTTVIGKVEEGEGVFLLPENIPMDNFGFDHFRSRKKNE